MRSKIATFLISFALASAAHADSGGWNTASRQWETSFDNSPVLFPSPYVAEVWTAARDDEVRDAHIYPETIQDSRFASGSFKVELQTKRAWFHAEKAPLMLYIPGLFTNMDDHSAQRAAAFFSERGYHVVVPSNPWSTEFLKEQPTFDPGTLDVEAEVMLSALQFAIQKIGPENVTRVEISGESYGAMLTAIAYAKDQQSASPMINGNATLFSPPIDMSAAINNLDAGIDANQSSFSACESIGTLFDADNECDDHTSQSELSSSIVQCSEPLVYDSFHSNLVSAVELFHSFRPTGTIPTDPTALQAWASALRFNSLLTEYLPQSQGLLDSGEGLLIYWLSQLNPNSMQKVRILTTKDDILNTGVPWLAGTSVIQSENLMELPWGGHTGYMELASFQDLLNTSFIASEP